MRVSNKAATAMYQKVRSLDSEHVATLWHPVPLRRPAPSSGDILQFGYVVYRQVLSYYSNEEDAYGECATAVLA